MDLCVVEVGLRMENWVEVRLVMGGCCWLLYWGGVFWLGVRVLVSGLFIYFYCFMGISVLVGLEEG